MDGKSIGGIAAPVEMYEQLYMNKVLYTLLKGK